MTRPAPPGPLADPLARRREWRSWCFHDWANSAFVTTVGTVLLGPYLTAVAERAACGGSAAWENRARRACRCSASRWPPGSLSSYSVTVGTLLPVVGAVAGRSSHKRHMLAGFAWAGAAAACPLFFSGGDRWEPIVALMLVAGVCLGSSIVVYDDWPEGEYPLRRDYVQSNGADAPVTQDTEAKV